MKIKIAFGSDHAGFQVKKELIKFLAQRGYDVLDLGAHSEDSSDYPDYALRVGKAVTSGRVDRGILACGSGLGMCIAANKVEGIRAVVPWSVPVAKLASEHNWANVICLPSRFVSISGIKKIVLAWLNTDPSQESRHKRRVKKIRKIESKA